MDHHQIVGWQPNPDRRGTLNVVQSCLFTILACTWSIQHLNLPAHTDGPYARVKRQLFWTLLTILAPEFLLARAIDHKIWAHETLKFLKKSGVEVVEDTGWWRLIFRRRKPRKLDVEAPFTGEAKRDSPPKNKMTLKHCYYGNMGGFVLRPDTSHLGVGLQNLSELPGYPVTTDELVNYLKGGPHESPAPAGHTEEILNRIGLTEDDINDKDKADVFTRIIALVQIVWLVLTILTRKAHDLATSQLEIITLAFAGCAFLTYCFHWDTPKNIQISKSIPVGANEILKVRSQPRPLRFWNVVRPKSKPRPDWKLRLRNDIIRPRQSPPLNVLTLLLIIMIVVGSVHLLAWDFSFPTKAERVLWQIAALVTVAAPITLQLFTSILPVVLAWPFSWYYERRVRDRAQQFVLACIEAMRDYDAKKYEEDGTRPFDIARRSLETGSSLNYKRIFDLDHQDKDHLKTLRLNDLGAFIANHEESKYVAFLPDFRKQFSRLTKIIVSQKSSEHRRGWWRLLPKSWARDSEFDDVDLTDKFPRYTRRQWEKRIRSTLMRYLFPIISIAYMVSRLITIVVAFSSLRAMPDSVYNTAWTKYVPMLQ